MAFDSVIFEKVEQNRFILGMTTFCIGILLNTLTVIILISTKLVGQTTGFYLLFLTIADTIRLISGVLMEEFYNPLIDVDVFYDSGEPVILCQIFYFLREMSYYWRWLLLAIIVIDRCLLMTHKTHSPRFTTSTITFTITSGTVSAILAGYWIYWVNDTLISGEFLPKSCLFTLTPNHDNASVWFYMEALGEFLSSLLKYLDKGGRITDGNFCYQNRTFACVRQKHFKKKEKKKIFLAVSQVNMYDKNLHDGSHGYMSF